MGPPQILTKVAVSSCKEKNTNQTWQNMGGKGAASKEHRISPKSYKEQKPTQDHQLCTLTVPIPVLRPTNSCWSPILIQGRAGLPVPHGVTESLSDSVYLPHTRKRSFSVAGLSQWRHLSKHVFQALTHVGF